MNFWIRVGREVGELSYVDEILFENRIIEDIESVVRVEIGGKEELHGE